MAEMAILTPYQETENQAAARNRAFAGDPRAPHRLWVWRMAGPSATNLVFRAWDCVAICDYSGGHRIIVVDPEARRGVGFKFSTFTRKPISAVHAASDPELISWLVRAAGHQPGSEIVRALFARWEAHALALAINLLPDSPSPTSRASKQAMEHLQPQLHAAPSGTTTRRL